VVAVNRLDWQPGTSVVLITGMGAACVNSARQCMCQTLSLSLTHFRGTCSCCDFCCQCDFSCTSCGSSVCKVTMRVTSNGGS